VAQAQPRAAGPAGAGLTAQRGDLRRAGGRVRRWYRHCLEVRHGDRGAAGCPVPEAAPGAAGRQEGRARLPGHRRHPNPIDRVAADRPFYSGKHI